MDYVIKQDPDIQAVVIEAVGMINTTNAEVMVLHAGRELMNSRFKRCFFDLSQTTVDPEQAYTDMICFIQIFQKAGISRSTRIAALYVTDPEPRQYLEGGANFLNYNLKHFMDRDAALEWLCQPSV